jgi:hypothetical protein
VSVHFDLADWPGEPAAVVVALRADGPEKLAQWGPLDQPREWASVSKLAVAYAAACAVSRGDIRLSVAAGPPGSSLEHLLAHASGLGLEESSATSPVGSRRVYSNVGIDIAAATCAGTEAVGEWLNEGVFAPLAMAASLRGRASSGVVGSVDDLVLLGLAWLRATGLTPSVHQGFTTPAFASLDGVVPGWGRWSPCEWGLGPEIKGSKTHWMGTLASPLSYGHFGMSGALLLIDPLRSVLVAATSTVDFGPWARKLWSQWIDQAIVLADA